MHLLDTPDACRRWCATRASAPLALVPTMGALHAGHEALIQMAGEQADIVAVSIFVNPMQFGPREDLTRYPRPKEADLARCQALGVHAVFAPDPKAMYPQGVAACTRVTPPESLANRLCGRSRPGHFTGVATVVLKLLMLLMPDIAVFGEKDAQQLAIIRRMAGDLNLATRILTHPVVREPDGLAMSSRNQYLTRPDDRTAALSLSRTLFSLARALAERGAPQPASVLFAEVLAQTGDPGFTLEYLEAVDDDTFEPVETLGPGVRLLMAGQVGPVRLIDTLRL